MNIYDSTDPSGPTPPLWLGGLMLAALLLAIAVVYFRNR